jgi:hypothetical protein
MATFPTLWKPSSSKYNKWLSNKLKWWGRWSKWNLILANHPPKKISEPQRPLDYNCSIPLNKNKIKFAIFLNEPLLKKK